MFRTVGHYGSTFWDSVLGDEELVLNICDDCLRQHSERLGQQKRYLPVRSGGFVGLGQQWVDRPLVAYTGNRDDSELPLEPEELGTEISHVEWPPDIAERKADILEREAERERKRKANLKAQFAQMPASQPQHCAHQHGHNCGGF